MQPPAAASAGLFRALTLDHVGVVVPDLDAARAFYAQALGCEVAPAVRLEEHDIAICFVAFANLRIELISPLGLDRPARDLLGTHTSADFLARVPGGGLHHFCYLTPDLGRELDGLRAAGVRTLGTGEPVMGASGLPIVFLDPDTTGGSLIELKQAG